MTHRGSLALLGAMLTIWGAAVYYGDFEPLTLSLTTLGCLAIVAAVAAGRSGAPGTLACALALGSAGPAVLAALPGFVGDVRLLALSRILVFTACLIALGVVASTEALRRVAWWATAVLGALAAVVMVRASPQPMIDVWYFMQGSAKALLHGHNPYTQHWAGSKGVTDVYPYLPLSFVVLAPFRLLLGDVRYGLAAAWLLGCWLVRRTCPAGRRTDILSALLLVLPGTLHGLAQTWTEPLLFAELSAMVAFASRGRPTAATVMLAAALATKQHMIVLLPLAALWPALGWRRTTAALGGAVAVSLPWFLADPHAFLAGTLHYHLDQPPRPDSLSLYLHVPVNGRAVLLGAVLLIGVVTALVRTPRTPGGFLLGASLTLASVDLVNKQSFYNQWQLVAALAITGLAAASVEPDEHRQHQQNLGRSRRAAVSGASS